MATRIRVPLLLDVVLVSEPSEIRALDDEPLIDRRFIPRGPLLNRLIVERIRRWFEIEDRLLPSLLPRADKDRAKEVTRTWALPFRRRQGDCSIPHTRPTAQAGIQRCLSTVFGMDFCQCKSSGRQLGDCAALSIFCASEPSRTAGRCTQPQSGRTELCMR